MKRTGPFVYQRVRGALMEMISEGNLGPGDKLPSERELAKQLGCNFHTVRKGLALLEKERVIERRVGAGTFLLRQDQAQTAVMDVPRAGIGAKQSTRTVIGAICPLTWGTFGAEFLHYLHQEAERRGYLLNIRAVNDYGPSARKAAEEFVEQGCFAVFLPLLGGRESTRDLWELVDGLPIPVVLTKPASGLEKYCYERPEVYGRPSFASVELACRYFQALGYRQIAFLGGDQAEYYEDLQRRVLAYTRYLSREGLPTHLALVGPNAQDVDVVVERWLAMRGELAVVAWGDEHAVRLMTSLHKHNVRIPEDVAVLGFGDISLARTTDPPLSTIRFGYEYVAKAMLDHAEALSRGESAQGDGRARQRLVIRESCGGRLRAGEKLAAIVEAVQRENEEAR